MDKESFFPRTIVLAMTSCLALTNCVLPHAEGPEGVDRVAPGDIVAENVTPNDVDVPTPIDMPTGGPDADVVDDRPTVMADADVLDVADARDVFDAADVSNDRPDVPMVDMPNPVDIPTDIPNRDVPNFDVPNFDVPNFDVPNVDVPNVDVPNVDVPNAVDVPDLPVRCADIVGGAMVQVRRLRGGNGGPWNALCDFASPNGPWTLVAKVDGTDGAWRYDSGRWTDAVLINENNVNANRESAKYQGFVSLSFSAMRVVTETDVGIGFEDWRQRSLTFTHNSMGQSLTQMFATGNPINIAGADRNAWLGLIPVGALLQDNCNRIAFNSRSDDGAGNGAVRLGIITNGPNDCNGADSWIGAGGTPTDRFGNSLTAGNRRVSLNPLDIRRTPSWYFLWVR